MACVGCGGGGGNVRAASVLGYYVNNSVSTTNSPWATLLDNTAFVDRTGSSIASDNTFSWVQIQNYGSGDVWVKFGLSSDTDWTGDPESDAIARAYLIPAGEFMCFNIATLFGTSGASRIGLLARTVSTAVSIQAGMYNPTT